MDCSNAEFCASCACVCVCERERVTAQCPCVCVLACERERVTASVGLLSKSNSLQLLITSSILYLNYFTNYSV